MNGGTLYRMVAAGLGAILLAIAPPAAAQQFSDGYKFLQAVDKRDMTAATELLDAPGSTVANSRDITNGRTGMHIAVDRRDVSWIQFLARRGANPNIRDNRGTTPMMRASQLGFVEGVQALIAAGARVDDTNDAGETPLISAVHRRNSAMIRSLLAAGADADRRDNSGRSARDYAEQAGARVKAEFEREEGDASAAESRPAPAEIYGPSF